MVWLWLDSHTIFVIILNKKKKADDIFTKEE